MGVRGAAIGLGTGQVVAAVIALVSIFRGSGILKFRLRKLVQVDLSILSRIVRVGTPSMFEQLCVRAGNIMFTRVVASLGDVEFATHQIAMDLHQFTYMNGTSFGVAATSLLGQSLGKKRPDQGNSFVMLCRRFAQILALSFAAIIVVFNRQLVGLYVNDPMVVAMGATLLYAVAILQPLQSSQQVIAGALRGAGDTKGVAVCTFLGVMIIRPLMSYVFVNIFGLGLMGVWLGIGLDQGMRSLYTLWRFNSGKWRTIKV